MGSNTWNDYPERGVEEEEMQPHWASGENEEFDDAGKLRPLDYYFPRD